MTKITDAQIKDSFYNMKLPNQVAVYAEALVHERYELLHVLKNLIHTTDKPVFFKMVQDYRIGKYGR